MAEFIRLTMLEDGESPEMPIFLNKCLVNYVGQIGDETVIHMANEDVIFVKETFAEVSALLSPVFSSYTPVFTEVTSPNYMRPWSGPFPVATEPYPTINQMPGLTLCSNDPSPSQS